MNAFISDIRLTSQQLSGTQLQTPKELVLWMGAMQAQDYTMVKWAIGIRLPWHTNNSVEEAYNRGDILRTHVMRPTWHLVSPENIRWMLKLSAEKIKASIKPRDRLLGLTEEHYTYANQVIEKVLEGNHHLTREAIAVELERVGIPTDTAYMTHFMIRAELEGLVCSGSMRGKSRTYALLDERVPPTKPLNKEEALTKLAQLYFTSHCPATLQDFAWWSGLSQTDAKMGLEAIKADFCSEVIEEQTYWIAPQFSKVAPFSASSLLLPAFDEYIISYRDRSAVLPLESHSQAITSNGIFHPIIVQDGQVIGLWKKSSTKPNSVDFDFFTPSLDTPLSDAIKAYKTFWDIL